MSELKDKYLQALACNKISDVIDYVAKLEKDNELFIDLVNRICIANGIDPKPVFEDFYEKNGIEI